MKNSENKVNLERGLKILALFIHRYRWGEQIRGDERGFLEKMRLYRDLGVEVYVIELRPSLQQTVSEKVYTSLLINLNLKWGDNALNQLTNLLLLTINAVHLSRKVRFNVIYVHNQDLENVVPALFIKFLSKRPMVIVFHLFYNDYALCFRKAFSRMLSKGFRFMGALLRSILGSLRRCAFRNADLIICVSDSVKDDVTEHISAERVAVVHNGVNTNFFKKYEFPKTYDAAFLGRLCPQKGLDVLLNAWRLVTLEFKEAKLVLIGGGDKKHIARYRDLIHELQLEDTVELKGFVPDKELVILLNSSKLFVFPSRYDGFALAVSEAMACGLPCVVSDIPALRENYGGAAVLMKPNDVGCLADAIKELLKDETKRELLSRRSRELACKLDWRKTVDKEIGLITNLLQRT